LLGLKILISLSIPLDEENTHSKFIFNIEIISSDEHDNMACSGGE
jgi:hypothetical protein